MEYSEIIFELAKRIEKTKDENEIDEIATEIISYIINLRNDKHEELWELKYNKTKHCTK